MFDDKVVFDRQKKTLLEIQMSDENKVVINEYLRTLKNENLKTGSQNNYINTLIVFCKAVNCEFSEISKLDLYAFLDYLDNYTYTSKSGIIKNYGENTKKTYKIIARRFLAYLSKKKNREGGKYLKCLQYGEVCEIIQTKRSIGNNKLPSDMLTKEEIEKLIDCADHPRDRALIAVLYESGARKGEMLSCNLGHVAFDDYGCVLTFPSGKTGARRVRLIYASSYLHMWLDTHPLREQKDAPLWCTIRQPYNRCAVTTIDIILKHIAERAGITKKINPHNFRHSRATHLAGVLTEQQMKIVLGWTPGSNMPATYVHLSGKDVDDAILKMHGIVKGDIRTDSLRVGVCPRCKHINPEIENYCGKCGLPLTQTEAQKIENDKSEIDLELMRATILSPDILAEIEKRLRG